MPSQTSAKAFACGACFVVIGAAHVWGIGGFVLGLGASLMASSVARFDL